MKSALIIGGTGNISMSITRLLAGREDWRLFLLNRGNRRDALPDGVETIVADIARPEEAKRALGDREFDAVADFIAFTPDDARRDVELFRGRARQYIFISSASAYQKPVTSWPITESTPLHNPYWQYSRDKAAGEELLMDEYRRNSFPATIVRPSHTYGDRRLPLVVQGRNNQNWQVLDRMRREKPVILPGDGTSLWTVTHADDFAVGFVGLMANPRAIGQAFHITSDDVLTWDLLYGCVADALGVKLNAVHIPSVKIAETRPDQLGNLIGDKAVSAVFDNSKIRRFVPEFNPTIRFSDAVRKTVATILASPELQIPDPEFDAWCDMMAEKWG